MVDYTIPGDDAQGVQEPECVPVMVIGMNLDANVGVPETRAKIEDEVRKRLGYIEQNVYSTVRGGPATHENIKFYAEIPTAEFWSSIDRSVQSLKDWLTDTGMMDDPGRDLSITLDAGDPEVMVREAEEGFRR